MKTICVIGLGYIGLPTASLFANNGFHVLGVDANVEVVRTVNSGKAHLEEVGLRTLVEAAVGSGRLVAATNPQPADVFIIAVPTPFDQHKNPDLTSVFNAVDSIMTSLRRDNLVVVESTVPPGTTENVAKHIAKRRTDLVKNNGDPTSSLSVLLAHCPERVLPGKILKELVDNDRVVGGLSQKATALATELYSKIVSGKIYPTDATTAEMVKLSENTFRDVNISLANELAIMCEKLGINVWEVVALANKHPRVNLLKPGPGVGGHCIAVDPWFLVYKFPQDAQVIRAARLRNDLMPKMVVEKILSLLGDKPGQKIACLGAAFKANVDDGRNSPAVEIFQMLTSALGEKGEVVLNDMHVSDPRLPLQNLEQVLERASLIVLLTDHDEYADLDPAKVAINVKAKVIFDTRNHLDHRRWRDAGFDVYLLGDGSNAS